MENKKANTDIVEENVIISNNVINKELTMAA